MIINITLCLFNSSPWKITIFKFGKPSISIRAIFLNHPKVFAELNSKNSVGDDSDLVIFRLWMLMECWLVHDLQSVGQHISVGLGSLGWFMGKS